MYDREYYNSDEFALNSMLNRMCFVDTHIEFFTSHGRMPLNKFKAAAYDYFTQVKNYNKDYYLDYFGGDFFHALRSNPELADPIWVDLNASLFDKAIIDYMKKNLGV